MRVTRGLGVPDRTPGRKPGRTPGRAPGRTPDRKPGTTPGRTPGQIPIDLLPAIISKNPPLEGDGQDSTTKRFLRPSVSQRCGQKSLNSNCIKLLLSTYLHLS